MSSKQVAAQVRKAVKAAGFGRADITVSSEADGIDFVIYVTLRRADISRFAIEALGAPLLSAGMVLDVGYDNGVLDAAVSHVAWMLAAGVTSFAGLQVAADGRELRDEAGQLVMPLHPQFGAYYSAEPIARALAERGRLAGVLAGDAPRP